MEWSFDLRRGLLAAATYASEHDFIVAGAMTRPVGEYFRIASRWWSLFATLTRPLLARHPWEGGGSVLAVLRHHGPQSERTLDIAAQIASLCETSLTVAHHPDIADADKFAAWVSGVVEQHSLSLRTEAPTTEPAALRQRIIKLDCRLLVLEGGPGKARLEELRALIEPLACDILIVR